MCTSLGDLALLLHNQWVFSAKGCEVVVTTTSVALLAMAWTIAQGVVVATVGRFGVGQ